MARIKTALTAKSGVGDANAAEWRRLIDELNLRRRAAAEGGSIKARERHVARGKLLARERVAGLIDPDSPFLEIGALAAFGMYEGDVHGAGLVAGIGLIEGREVMIIANWSTRAGPICLTRLKSFPTATISGGFSSTRRACRQPASPKSRW